MKKLRFSIYAIVLFVSCVIAGEVDENDPAFLALAEKLAKQADARSPEFMAGYLDTDAYFRRVIPGKNDNAQLQAFVASVRKKMKNFGSMFLQAVEKDTRIRLVSVRKRSGEVHAFLSAHAGIGLAYLGFILQKNADGSASVVDFYDVSGGQNSSDELRQILLGALTDQPDAVESLLGAGSGDLAPHIQKLPQINQAMDANNPARALELIDSMPPKMQIWRSVRMARIVAASTINEALMLRTIERFEADFPNDPSLAVLTFARLFKQKKYPQALQSLKAIETVVGNDAYLDLVRSRVQQLNGDLKEARRLCEIGMKTFPNVLDIHYQWVTILAEQKDYKTLTGAFNAMKKLPRGIELADDLLGMDKFADFVKSPEYHAWDKK